MKQAWLALLAWLALFAAASGAVTRDAPYNGAAFLKNQLLGNLPSWITDENDPDLSVTHLLPNRPDTGPASRCFADDPSQADKNKCLYTADRECMWARVESRDPLLAVQEAKSVCLPCEVDGQDIPCWNVGAWVEGKQVTDCEMSCPHQKRIRQPEYACGDESGFITNTQCFDKGVRSGSKCMWVSYEKDGQQKSACGPCALAGSGGWGCPAVGADGPEDGSKVTFCLSQCDVICPGPPDCPPTVAPPPPPPPPSPGVPDTDAGPNEMLLAPAPYAMPTVNPYMIAQAAANAAKAAGWEIGTLPPPKTYYPVVMYRNPMDYAWTPGPPPSTIAYPAPPALLQAPPEMATEGAPWGPALPNGPLLTTPAPEQAAPARNLLRRNGA